MDKKLQSKFNIKTGHAKLVINKPKGFKFQSFKADKKPQANIHYDFILGFAKDTGDVERIATIAINLVKMGSLFWIAYPKKLPV